MKAEGQQRDDDSEDEDESTGEAVMSSSLKKLLERQILTVLTLKK